MLSKKAGRRSLWKVSGAPAPRGMSQNPRDVHATTRHAVTGNNRRCRATSTVGSTDSPRPRHAVTDTRHAVTNSLRDWLITIGAVAIAVAIIVVTGKLADAAPPLYLTVAGYVAFIAIVIVVAFREEGR